LAKAEKVGYCPHCGKRITTKDEWDEHIPDCSREAGHMSLNLDIIETPYQAYRRKMPDKEGIITDEKSGEIYHAHKK